MTRYDRHLLSWLILATSLLFSGCQPTDSSIPSLDNLNQLVALHDADDHLRYNDFTPSKANPVKADQGLRVSMMRDMGLTLGAQAGLAYQAKLINADVDRQAEQLSQIYDFHRLMLPENIVPPVLEEARQTVDLTSGSELQLNDRLYQIVNQAHFSTDVPRWQDYLQLHYDMPELPAKGLWPRNTAEQHAWQDAVNHGWQLGLVQAKEIYAANLARLQRDYRGMILYRQLLAQNMVTAPHVAEQQYGVTGGGNHIAVNQRRLTITAMPSLKASTQSWQARAEHQG